MPLDKSLELLELNDPSLKKLTFRTEPSYTDDESLTRLFLALKKNTHIHTLSLKHSYLDLHDFQLLAYCLEQHPSVKELDLSSCRWDIRHEKAFVHLLKHAQCLEKISLKATYRIFYPLSESGTIIRVELNHLPDQFFQIFSYSLAQLSHLRELDLSHTGLCDHSLGILVGALKTKQLDHLNIAQNHLGPEYLPDNPMIRSFAHGLENTSRLIRSQCAQSFTLSTYYFKDHHHLLLDALQDSPSVTKIIFVQQQNQVTEFKEHQLTLKVENFLDRRKKEQFHEFFNNLQISSCTSTKQNKADCFVAQNLSTPEMLSHLFDDLTFSDKQNFLAALSAPTVELTPVGFTSQEQELHQRYACESSHSHRINSQQQSSSSLCEDSGTQRRYFRDNKILRFAFNFFHRVKKPHRTKIYLSN